MHISSSPYSGQPTFGHTFRFISHDRLSNDPKTRGLVMKGYDLTKRTPVLRKRSNRMVGSPFTMEQTKGTSRTLFSPAAVVCTMFRYGADRGKQRVGHLAPESHRAKTFAEKVEMIRADIRAFRERQNATRPFVGAILGGCRDSSTSVELKEAVVEAFQQEKIPFSLIWGQPFSQAGISTSLMTFPKVKKGVSVLAVADGARENRDLPIEPKEPCGVPLFKASATRQGQYDPVMTRASLAHYFSDIELLPQHRLMIGDDVVIEKGQKTLA